jgi:AcrR family transcriptional regulator
VSVEAVVEPRPSLRERKKTKTRQALLDAADKMFAARGYEATTLEDICDAAEVSLRTFFRYFDSKLDLALEANHKNAQRRREGLAGPDRDVDVFTFLRESYAEMAREFADDRYALQRFRLLRDESTLQAKSLLIEVQSERDIADALRKEIGGPDAELHARLIAAMIVSGIRFAVLKWMQSGGTVKLERQARNVIDAVEELAAPWRQ